MDGDGALLQRARKGDETAFSELYARHHLSIFRYALYMGSRDLADDVVQETFLAVLQQSQHVDPPRSGVVAYLLGIARHVVLRRLQMPANMVSDGEAEWIASGDASPLEELTRAERIAAVRAAIRTLPAAYREAIVLCELHEMEYAAAAQIMQCPVGTVRSRLARARALLLRKVSEEPRWANARTPKMR